MQERLHDHQEIGDRVEMKRHDTALQSTNSTGSYTPRTMEEWLVWRTLPRFGD
jgi:hypothetical protein